MSFIAAAIIGATTIGAAVIGSRSSRRASDAAQETATENNALQREVYGRNTANLTPFMQSGTGAQTSINALLGLGGNPAAQQQAFKTYRDSTGYQFAQNEARRGVTGSFAARGLGQSGAALKALSDRSQQIGNSYFGNYLSALQNQQGVGLSAANALAGVGTNYANAVGANNSAAGDARANAALAQGQIWGNALSGLGQLGGYVYGSSYK